MDAYESSMLGQLLPEYYRKLFPFKHYTKWLCYNQKPADYFSRREFAFILEEDVHLRYRSFADQSEFKQELCRIVPQKLDVGAVYSHPPKDNKRYNDFKAVERELVFDIDLTDYDNVRKCCSDAKVCSKCWRFIVIAIRVLDKLLEDHFGFVARMWVFSGRRGVHCWIGDEKARKLNNIGRSAVAEYLSLIVGDKLEISSGKKNQRDREVHPMVETAYRTIMDCGQFDRMVLEQKWLELEPAIEILEYCEDSELKAVLKAQFERLETPELRWKALKCRFDEKYRIECMEQKKELPPAVSGISRDFLRWFVLWHSYPRLDINVSTGLNHLLKSPFCIHPKTGNVAVPLDISTIHEFDVEKCPRIDILINELMRSVDNNEDIKENRKMLGYKHTSLAPYVVNFEKFVDAVLTA